MKYQIYLNKETTELINEMAEKGGLKPATIIKQLIETFCVLSRPVQGTLLNEITPQDQVDYLKGIKANEGK